MIFCIAFVEDSLIEGVCRLCVSLVEKWEKLEEVFKIPKKANVRTRVCVLCIV